MTEDEYRMRLERERWAGLNFVRKEGARVAASLGLASYSDWMRDVEFERDLSHFRARWLLGIYVARPTKVIQGCVS